MIFYYDWWTRKLGEFIPGKGPVWTITHSQASVPQRAQAFLEVLQHEGQAFRDSGTTIFVFSPKEKTLLLCAWTHPYTVLKRYE